MRSSTSGLSRRGRTKPAEDCVCELPLHEFCGAGEKPRHRCGPRLSRGDSRVVLSSREIADDLHSEDRERAGSPTNCRCLHLDQFRAKRGEPNPLRRGPAGLCYGHDGRWRQVWQHWEGMTLAVGEKRLASEHGSDWPVVDQGACGPHGNHGVGPPGSQGSPRSPRGLCRPHSAGEHPHFQAFVVAEDEPVGPGSWALQAANEGEGLCAECAHKQPPHRARS